MYFLPTKKVAVLTPLATNVSIRLNQMKLLVFDHIGPAKMAIACGLTYILEKKLSFAYNKTHNRGVERQDQHHFLC